jgi:ADP-heptose:LPS heptosyltransferase
MAMSPCLVVLRALGLGDLLTSIPALRGLRMAFPDHRIVLCAPTALSPLALLSGAVDEVHDTVGLGGLSPGLCDVDLAVNLHGRGPDSHLLLQRIAPRRLLAFAHPKLPWTASGPRWRPREHEVQRWCRMLAELNVSCDPDDLRLSPPWPRRRSDTTVIHPGAGSASRRWPAERYAAVARAELARGRDIVITGCAAERSLGLEVASLARAGEWTVAAGRTPLLELAALVASASRVVCGDTGIGHLATALHTPSVLLFGPTSPKLWGPPPNRRHIVLWHGQEGDPHGGQIDPGLLEIEVGEVLDALDQLEARCACEGTVGVASAKAGWCGPWGS